MDDGGRLINRIVTDINESYATLTHRLSIGVVVVTGFAVWRLIQHVRWGRCAAKYSMLGKTVLITGANSGIGRATALEMAKRDAKVILACRNADAAEDTVKYIRKYTSRGELLAKRVDLASFVSIRSFAQEIESGKMRVDVLVNNAGVYGCPLQQSADGFELHFAVNHLGHFLLTHLLMNRLKESEARVIVVTSAYYSRGKLDFANLDKVSPYSSQQAYSNSKLANMLFGIELDRRLQNTGVKVFMVSPGMVWTNLGRHVKMAWWKKVSLAPLMFLFVKMPHEGCQTILHCAMSDQVNELSGRYFRNCQVTDMNTQAVSPELATQLWDVSATLVKVD